MAKVEQQLNQLITSDDELNRLFNLITSVEGIGAITAREIIVPTNERPPLGEDLHRDLDLSWFSR